MDEQSFDLMMKLPKKNIINLMWDALGFMQQYNGRSRFLCVMLAMDAKKIGEGEWKLPILKELKEDTEITI